MPHTILAIPAFNDNYIWAIVHAATQQVVVVDPGDATPVRQALAQQNWQLAGILITHHHRDHTGGVSELCADQPVPVFGPHEAQGPYCNHIVQEGDIVSLPELELQFNVLDIPGHTLGHIAFVGHEWLFCGDTLFTGGCGRLFEGTPDALYHSLSKLAHLEPTTRVYCGHEYTTANLQFAATVEPQNELLQQRIKDTEQQRAKGLPTVPSTIGLEQQTNPFLRCHLPQIQQAVQNHCDIAQLADEVAVFSKLRYWKDQF